MGYRRPDDSGLGQERAARVRRVLWTVLALNLAVAFAKLGWGVYSNSAAMQADGFHSMFDGTSNVIGLIGIWLAARPADREHPYGHAKFETYASAAIAAMLMFAAYRIGSSAMRQLADGGVTPTVDAVSFAVMVGTLMVNTFVTTWERREGRRLSSEVLTADATHTASDVIVSVGVILSLVLVRVGEATGRAWMVKADPVVALLVAVAIVFTAYNVFRHASATLSDAARLDPAEIRAVCLQSAGVLGCHHIRTRGSESEVYVDLHVQVDGTRTVADGHRIAEAVERRICDHFPSVADAIVHLEPFDEYQVSKTAEESDAGLA